MGAADPDPFPIPSTDPSSARSGGSSVACVLSAALLEEAANRGIPASRLVFGSGCSAEELQNRSGYAPWSAFHRLLQNAGEIWSDAELTALGALFARSPRLRALRAVGVHLFRTPGEFLTWLAAPTHLAISCVQQSVRAIERDKLVIDTWMSPGCAPSRPFCLIRAGFLAELPRVIGHRAADVRIEELGGPTGAVRYHLHWRTSWRTKLGLHRLLVRSLSKRELARELRDTLERLQERQLDAQARIVELERARRTVELSEERHRRIAELASDYFYVVRSDATGHHEMEWVGGAIERITGYRGPTVTVREWLARVHPDDVETVRAHHLRAGVEGLSRASFRIRTRTGEERWIEEQLSASPHADGGLQVFGVASDRTALHAAQIARKESDERFQRVFRSAPVAMLISGVASGRIVDANDRFLSEFSLTREQVVGRTATELGIWADLQVRDALRGERAERGRLYGAEARVRGTNGKILDVLLTTERVSIDGEVCDVWSAVDISARKRVERELELHRHTLEEQVAQRTAELDLSLERLRDSQRLASLGTLAAGIAHQINNPIAGIRAVAELGLQLGDEPGADASRQRALERCVEEALRCSRIVRGVLQFARGEVGERWPGNLVSLARQTAHLAIPYLRERHARLDLALPDAEVLVEHNPIELEQVLLNVLHNAANSRDGARIELGLELLGDSVSLRVRDDGAGISREHLPHVFDPFFTTRLGDGGTGLGLSVAYGIVAAHGGELRIASEPGHGTQVEIWLPIWKGDA